MAHYNGLAQTATIQKSGENGPILDRASQNNHSGTLRARHRHRTPDVRKHLTADEISAFFRAITNHRDRALFRVVYHRGLRAHEPGLLRLSDFNARDGKLHVVRGKGSSGGEYRLTDEELRALRAYIRYSRGARDGPLFLSRHGRPISRRQVHRLMKRYCAAAGIDVRLAHPHALKHSCGVHLAERGEDLLDIQDHLGHRNVANTMIYVQITNKRRDARGERLKAWK